jgi:hypothetical protein
MVRRRKSTANGHPSPADASPTDVSPTAPRSEVVQASAAEINFFISHKSHDGEFAAQLRDQLEGLGGPDGKLKGFISDQLPGGVEWRPELLRQLAKADALILLYTDLMLNWDWCLFECGYFESSRAPDGRAKRIFILHDDATAPPTPLNDYQTIRVTSYDRSAVRHFVSDLLGKGFDGNLANIEETIVGCVTGYSQPEVFNIQIDVEIVRSELEHAHNEVPAGSRVYGNSDAFRLFSLRTKSCDGLPWTTFYQGMQRSSDNTDAWIRSLVRTMRDIVLSNFVIGSTSLPIYRFHRQGMTQVYRPSINSMRSKGNKLVFTVQFAEVPEEQAKEPAGEVTTLAQALSVSRIVRYSIIAPFCAVLTELLDPHDLPAGPEASLRLQHEMEQLFKDIDATYVDHWNRGYDRKALLKYFTVVKEKQTLARLCGEWDKLRSQIKPPSLDVEVAASEWLSKPRELKAKLEESLATIKQIMIMVAKRYGDALADED